MPEVTEILTLSDKSLATPSPLLNPSNHLYLSISRLVQLFKRLFMPGSRRLEEELEEKKGNIWKRALEQFRSGFSSPVRLQQFHRFYRGRRGANVNHPKKTRLSNSPKPSLLSPQAPSVLTPQLWHQPHIVDPKILSRQISRDSLTSAPDVLAPDLLFNSIEDTRVYAKSTTHLPSEFPSGSLRSLPPPQRRRLIPEIPSKLKKPRNSRSRSRSATPTSAKRSSGSSSHKSGRSGRAIQVVPHRPGSAFGMDNWRD
ncbi:hypothetical protein V5O48_002514 [Marasmius crinis-equi]|uniref:Uncharacterized protein n=1 Tax=Marasmius crinis-equi TaxID=585013 RepID=A0ABR3FVE2_9AGAR